MQDAFDAQDPSNKGLAITYDWGRWSQTTFCGKITIITLCEPVLVSRPKKNSADPQGFSQKGGLKYRTEIYEQVHI